MEIKNALIKSTTLGFDRGIMNSWLHLDYGGTHQGFGGHSFCIYNKKTDEREGVKYGMMAIIEMLKTVGVEKWEDLAGKYIRVRYDGQNIHAIGHVVNDEWFSFVELFNRLEKMESE